MQRAVVQPAAKPYGRCFLAVVLVALALLGAFGQVLMFVPYASASTEESNVQVFLYQICSQDSLFCVPLEVSGGNDDPNHHHHRHPPTLPATDGDNGPWAICLLAMPDDWWGPSYVQVGQSMCDYHTVLLAAGIAAAAASGLAFVVAVCALCCLRRPRRFARAMVLVAVLVFLAMAAAGLVAWWLWPQIEDALDFSGALSGVSDDIGMLWASCTAGLAALVLVLVLVLTCKVRCGRWHLYKGLGPDGEPLPEWGDGLFSCADDVPGLLLSATCPCLPIGESFRFARMGEFCFGASVSFITYCFGILPCLVCCLRRALYEQMRMAAPTLGECLAVGVCWPCAVAQDRRGVRQAMAGGEHRALIQEPAQPQPALVHSVRAAAWPAARSGSGAAGYAPAGGYALVHDPNELPPAYSTIDFSSPASAGAASLPGAGAAAAAGGYAGFDAQSAFAHQSPPPPHNPYRDPHAHAYSYPGGDKGGKAPSAPPRD